MVAGRAYPFLTRSRFAGFLKEYRDVSAVERMCPLRSFLPSPMDILSLISSSVYCQSLPTSPDGNSEARIPPQST